MIRKVLFLINLSVVVKHILALVDGITLTRCNLFVSNKDINKYSYGMCTCLCPYYSFTSNKNIHKYSYVKCT